MFSSLLGPIVTTLARGLIHSASLQIDRVGVQQPLDPMGILPVKVEYLLPLPPSGGEGSASHWSLLILGWGD